MAKAEAEASRVQAESEIQVTDLHRRTVCRFLEEEAKKQSNIEAITQIELPLLEDKSASQDVADERLTQNFSQTSAASAGKSGLSLR